MFPTIVIGLDGGHGGEDALALAHRLAEPDARLLGVCVEVGDRRPHAGVMDPDTALRAHADDIATCAALADASVQPESAVAGSVATGLHDAARRHGADLIVVGSSHRGAVGRVVAGDDAALTARDAPCAVAIAPRGYASRAREIRRLAVGYDGGPEAEAALEVGRRIAADRGGTAEAISVLGMPVWAMTPAAAVADVLTDDLAAVQQELDAKPGVRGRAVRGATVPTLAELSAGYDLLIVGARRHGRIGRVLMGSTGHALAHTAQAPLLVVPASPVASEARA
jgi:nucleotide-binding universal stress UspA family protein